MHFEKICVIGLGYVGLPTAALFSSSGIRTVGVDINKKIVDTINAGNIHIVEPGLQALVNHSVQVGMLSAQEKPIDASAFLIAVPTPITENNQPDISHVEAAVRSIAPYLKRGALIILESTSPVGTTERMCEIVAELRPDLEIPSMERDNADVHLAYCPERVLPGNAIIEMRNNDRIIGGVSKQCAAKARNLYSKIVEGECLVTSAKQAELTKLSENAFRDVSIAFANELSLICDQLGLDVGEVIGLANRHPRVNILQPGPGVGGHCIAVDPWFIVFSAPEQAQLIQVARNINDSKPHWVCAKVREAIAACGENRPTVALLGLSYKPNIDDLRSSPACKIAEMLCEDVSSQEILIVEPNIVDLPQKLTTAALVSFGQAINEADILVGLVAHNEFSELSNDRLRPEQVFIDVAGIQSV